MQNRIATAISYLFHPLFMPTVGILILFNSGSYLTNIPNDYKNYIYLIVFVGTAVLPISIFPVFMYSELIRDIHVDKRKERLLPLMITSILYFICYFMISGNPVAHGIEVFMLAASISVLITFLVSFFWKISTHMTGIGGITGLILGLSVTFSSDLMFYLILAFLASGVIAFARLQLNAHSPSQLTAGYFLGLTVMFAAYLL